MAKKIEIRRDNATFDLILPEFPKEIFADGLAQVMTGKVVSKFTLFSSDGPDENGIEQRKAIARIAMTNEALQNLVEEIIKNLEKIPKKQ